MRWILLFSAIVAAVISAIEFWHRHIGWGFWWAAVAIILLLLALLLPFLKLFAPFRNTVAFAGLPGPRRTGKQKSVRDEDLLRFEGELLRLVNEVRRSHGASQVSVHGPLLAEARSHSAEVSVRWRLFPSSLRRRLDRRDQFRAGLELVAVRSRTTPAELVDRWMRRRRTRIALLSGDYGVGAAGIVRESRTPLSCVTLILAELQR